MTESTAAPAAKPRVARGDNLHLEPLYPSTRLLKGAVLDAPRIIAEAKQQVEEAKAETARILEKARTEAEAVRREAFEQGARDAIGEFGKVISNLQEEISRLRGQFAQEVQRVAFTLAAFILKVEFQLKPERVVELVATVLRSTKLYSHIRVHLHPDDLALVSRHEQELKQLLPFANEIQFCADQEMQAHGVRVETELGTFDGSIETQIERLREHLRSLESK